MRSVTPARMPFGSTQDTSVSAMAPLWLGFALTVSAPAAGPGFASSRSASYSQRTWRRSTEETGTGAAVSTTRFPSPLTAESSSLPG